MVESVSQLAWQAGRLIHGRVCIPFVSTHNWSCLSDPYGLFNPSHISLSFSVDHLCSQSMMQLFLSAWWVIADFCSTVTNCLLCSQVNKFFGCDGLNFLFVLLESCMFQIFSVLPMYMWLQLLQICIPAVFQVVLWMH